MLPSYATFPNKIVQKTGQNERGVVLMRKRGFT
jgi:hypothetical protein